MVAVSDYPTDPLLPMVIPVEVYGTPEHAAVEALEEANVAYDRYVSASVESVAQAVVEGLRQRGFIVTREPRCECGWLLGNHDHGKRMGRA